MDTPTIRKKVKQLGSGFTMSKNTEDSNVEYYKNPYYVAPVLVLVILLILRPSFLYIELYNKERKLCPKKLFLYWALISGVIVVGIYGYKYKKENT